MAAFSKPRLGLMDACKVLDQQHWVAVEDTRKPVPTLALWRERPSCSPSHNSCSVLNQNCGGICASVMRPIVPTARGLMTLRRR